MKLKFFNIFLICLIIIGCKSNKDKNDENLETRQPNIIVILLDDAGYVDFGFMGSKDLETPHIDELAKKGVVFTDAHVSASVCAPSRAGLLSGTYQQRFGFEANHTGDAKSGDLGLGDDVITLASTLQKNKYKTIALGKWHLGASQDDQPNNRGFDEFYGFLDGARSYFPLKDPNEKRMLQQNGKRIKFEGYLTDVLTDSAIAFSEENKDAPYFMYLAYNAVHTPMEAKKEHLEKYKDHPRQKLAAMTWSLDENIGKLMAALKAQGIYENTLIYFLSDNGGSYANQSSNGYLKGSKGTKFEGGHRVPFIVQWPGKITAGQEFDGLTSSLDIYPTSLAAADIKKDETLNLDGVNLLPYLKNEKQGDPHKELYWRKLNKSAARVGDFKLIRLEGYGSNLYNLNEDLAEQHDLSQSDSLTLNELSSKLETWESGLIPPLWKESEEWMAVIDHVHKSLMQNEPIKYRNPRQMRQFNRNN
ncbi:sulfatase-like hydrolase/transferase [Christiangramia crocea]|uniref:Sulfatase-like hydrolase/transferase n=1 Tax=Christiangramia crocea TaxID=2904124 RepID=A0A9X1UZ01_9FLAO|nr:sulfatase-like hydrolase/transferase [Gramella crocea]MCG9972551.1 sulfatase-like hydrolase/transferase [Gramella crocea]